MMNANGAEGCATAILYKVPRIGSEPKCKQKGPTCWYYAAKVLLKFHGLYDKSAEAHGEYKTLHELRSVLTKNDFDTKKEVTGSVRREVKKCDAYAMLNKRKDSLKPNQQQSLKELEEWSKGKDVAGITDRLVNAIEAMDTLFREDLGRLELLITFVPAANFAFIPVDQYEKPEQIEDLLERWGPFYSGRFLVTWRERMRARRFHAE